MAELGQPSLVSPSEVPSERDILLATKLYVPGPRPGLVRARR